MNADEKQEKAAMVAEEIKNLIFDERLKSVTLTIRGELDSQLKTTLENMGVECTIFTYSGAL